MTNKISKHYLSVADIQVHFYKSGNKDISLLLFHESPQSAKVYLESMKFLSEVFTVYAFDTPGYGMSDAPKSPQKIESYASILCEVIKKLNIGQYGTGGCHTGASIALEVIKQFNTENAKFCVLNGVPYFSSEERMRYADNWSPDVEIENDGSHLLWAWNRYINIYGENSPKELINFGTVGILSCLEKYNWAYNAAFEYIPDDLIHNLDLPILYLNTKNDLLTHCDLEAAKNSKNATVSFLTDHPGQLHMREPELYANEIIKFYKTLS